MVDGRNRTLLHDVNLDMEAFWEEIPRILSLVWRSFHSYFRGVCSSTVSTLPRTFVFSLEEVKSQ
jgi:hypothetical protein